MQAAKVKKQLIKLQQQDKDNRINRLKTRHQAEYEQIIELMKQEYNNRQTQWLQKEQEIKDKQEYNIELIKQKQQEEIQQLKSQLEMKTAIFKPSIELSQMKSQIQQLTRLENFVKAQKVKQLHDQREQQEIQAFQANQERSIQRALENAKKHTNLEMQTYKQKMNYQIETLHKNRNLDLENLVRKQKNILKQLQSAQTQEMNRIQKAPLGTPFVLDNDGNDIISIEGGYEKIQQEIQKIRNSSGKKEQQSIIKAYRDGLLQVKPGDIYYSVSPEAAQQLKASRSSEQAELRATEENQEY